MEPTPLSDVALEELHDIEYNQRMYIAGEMRPPNELDVGWALTTLLNEVERYRELERKAQDKVQDDE